MSFLGKTNFNCELYEDTECRGLEEGGCEACFSGSFRCHFYDEDDDPGANGVPLGCRLNGVCEGTPLSIEVEIDNLDECNEACAHNAQCQWSSFDESKTECQLWTQCSSLTPRNQTFSSFVECAPERFDSTILIVNGNAGEIVNPYKTGPICTVDEAPFLQPPIGFLTWVNGQVLLCNDIGSCHVYDMNENSWEIVADQVPPVGSCPGTLNPNELFTLEPFNDTTHILDLKTFQFQPHIPRPPMNINQPCTVKLNETHFMTIGGELKSNRAATTATFIFDSVNKEWSEGEPLRVPISEHSCPLVTKSDGSSYVFVIGGGEGQRHTYVYDVQREFWRSGPNLKGDGAFRAIPFGKSILVESLLNGWLTFYELNPDEETWTSLPQEFQVNEYAFSLAIPNFLFPCNNSLTKN